LSESRPPNDARHAPRDSTLVVRVDDSVQSPRSTIPFHDAPGAQQALSRVLGRVSPTLAVAIPALLAESPDPDSALLMLERLLGGSGEVLRLLNRQHFLAHYVIVVFGHSRYLGETLIQNADILQSFLRERNLDRSFSREEFHGSLARFRSRSFEKDVSLLLARFKRREYVRIMLRDVLQLAPLAETTAEISALADALIEAALREAESRLQRRYGSPQHLDAEGRLVNTAFAILSLGKLGGNELNYSSDVDLMYIFGTGEEPAEAPISNREYFIRLAQQVTEILSRVTQEGPVFRIDLRLRPQGGEGELAVSIGHALDYYAERAHDWERQALIKVRGSAGDSALAREFIRGVQRHVYGRAAEQTGEPRTLTSVNQPIGENPPLSFEAIETALRAREKMHTRRRRAAAQEMHDTIDVKIDRGGIRDIEFLVQCLQRVYGGAEPWLRSGGTLFSLQKLHDKGHITGKEFHELTTAYQFLRNVEHRLQLRYGQQTHRLPVGEHDLRILQKSLEGYASAEDQRQDLTHAVRRRMASIAEIYNRIIHHQQARGQRELPAAQFELQSTAEAISADQSQQQILERLAADAPAVYEIARQTDPGSQARRNLFRFLSSALTGSDRYAAILRHPQALEKALALLDASDYLTEILIRHPEEISTLAELADEPARVRGGYLFHDPLATVERVVDSGVRMPVSDPVFSYVASSLASYGERLALLRQHYRHRVFAAGARDLTEFRDVYQSLADTSSIAEDAIAAAFAIAGSPEGLAVMALGRLGTSEFDVLSDADLLFVCRERADRLALTRSAEQMMQALSAYTREGMVFPVDARLRPRGGEGELLVTPAQLEAYFQQEAQPWEAMMYTKLRFLTGAPTVAQQASAATRVLFGRFAADPGFVGAVREMRSKLETAEAGEKNFKTSPGGTYDIDFLASYLLVKHGIPHKGGTLRERLWRVVAAGVLDKGDAAALDHAAEMLRTVEHVVRLVVGRAHKWLPATEHARQVSEQLAARILGRKFSEGLEVELLRTSSRVREIFLRVMQ
jgi:[glutamine synthetase] adenylyltransferase / [glutamine synthetase]-adenylyl-L-tyrosine phosphorylase